MIRKFVRPVSTASRHRVYDRLASLRSIDVAGWSLPGRYLPVDRITADGAATTDAAALVCGFGVVATGLGCGLGAAVVAGFTGAGLAATAFTTRCCGVLGRCAAVVVAGLRTGVSTRTAAGIRSRSPSGASGVFRL